MRVRPSLSPADELTIVRKKYPDGLWCTSPEHCEHRLIATTAAGWSKSWPYLPQVERLARRDSYICAECRHNIAARERVAQVRREKARIAGAASLGARRARAVETVTETPRKRPHVGEHGSPSSRPSRTRMNSGKSARVNLTARPVGPRRGGRPRKHSTDLARRRATAEYSRAYRARKKQEQISRNDAALVSI
jgi:hypothetical protein